MAGRKREPKIDYDELLTDLEDKYGSALFDVADQINGVIPTGSISLDIATGVGGIPRGRISEVYGDKSTGKTTTAISIMGNALRDGNRCAFIDMERTTTMEYIKAIVGDFDENLILFISPATAEQALEISETLIKSAIFSLIVFDSLGGALLESVENSELNDNTKLAALASLLTRWQARNSRLIKKNNVAFLFIGQVRANIGSYSRKPITPGGFALEHVLTLRIFFSHSKRIEIKDEIIGVESFFTIDKNKAAPPHRGGSLPIIFGTGIDYHRDVLNFASNMQVIKKTGSYFKFEEETLGQGFLNATKYLADPENSETLDKIVKLCYNIYASKKEDDTGEDIDEWQDTGQEELPSTEE